MVESKQNFLKGVNRRFDKKDSVDSDFFYTLSNVRISSRGDTGKIKRIEGFTKFNASSKNYTKILDILNFKDMFVIFYEDNSTANQFNIDILDKDGVELDSFNYNDTATSFGSLSQSESTIYISPHNKILYYDGTNFFLDDFIPTVPDITVSSNDVSTQATGSIDIQGGPTSIVGQKARGYITVIRNNTPVGQTDDWTITLGGDTSSQITTSYTDTEQQIAEDIYNACIGSDIETNWDISLFSGPFPDESASKSLRVVFVAKNVGQSTARFSFVSQYIIGGDSTDGGGSNDLIDFGSDGSDFNPWTPPDTPIGPISVPYLSVSTSVKHPDGTGFSNITDDFSSIYIRIDKPGISIRTEGIVATDTATTVANKIEDAFTNSTLFNKYFTQTRNSNEITITSKEGGKKWNSSIKARFIIDNEYVPLTDVVSGTVTDLTGGGESISNLGLEDYTDYAYKVRYRYLDGYITPTSNPKFINTGPSKGVSIDVDTSELDIDGQRPFLQIFRRKEGGDFYLIDEIRPSADSTQYQDLGATPKDILNERFNIFTKSHKAQDILENRYIRANINYFNEIYDDGNFNITAVNTTGEKRIPQNVKANLYVRPTYQDGSKGYFSDLGFVDVTDENKVFQVQQTSLVSNTDKEIEELGFYVNYKPMSEKFFFKFNSPEISNSNIPTIEDRSYFTGSTRIFFGFKYIEFWQLSGGNLRGVIRASGWDSDKTRQHGGFQFTEISPSGGIDFPRTVSVSIFGINYEYVRIGVKKDSNSNFDTAIYKLDVYESLQQAIRTGKLRLKLTGATSNLSSTKTRDDFLNEEVRVTGLIDYSSSFPEFNIFNEDDRILVGPSDTRLYLQLEESLLDEVDNRSVNRYNLYRSYDFVDAYKDFVDGFPRENGDTSTYNLSFELINFKEKNSNSFNTQTGDGVGEDGGLETFTEYNEKFYQYFWDYSDYQLIDLDLISQDNVIYIGSLENAVDTNSLPLTGYEFEKDNDLYYSRLEESNLYENLVLRKDFSPQTKFTNQIIWSNPLVLGNKYSGGRTFEVDNFLNIGSEYGEILEIKSLNNRLYVFCEKAVALVYVGETLTEQKSGQVFINSSSFLNNHVWIITNLVDVQKDSIIKTKNEIFFTDTYDVYRISSEGLQNISNGLIELTFGNTYYGTVDQINNEYCLSDEEGSITWTYNFELNNWTGPHDFVFKKGDAYRNTVLGNNGTDIVERNVGTDFNGQSYTSIIESVANDNELSFYDKNYRKFYIQSNGGANTDFFYDVNENFTANESITLSTMKVKNGYKNQGIKPDLQNNKVIFWKIESDDNNFELNDLSYIFTVNNRR